MKNSLIALIDDDELDRFIYKKIILLTCSSCKIIDFANGHEALEYLKRHSDNAMKLPDMVLLDLRMPFLNGWQYLEKYSEIKSTLVKHSHHYVCTSSMERFDIDFKSNDLHGYYMKPISPNDVLKMIQEFEEYHKNV